MTTRLPRPAIKLPRLRRDELLPTAVALVVVAALNALCVFGMNYKLFTRCGRLGYDTLFHIRFTLSGFDQTTYTILSTGRAQYSHYRHPLLYDMVRPLHLLNKWLMEVTGMNCAIFIVGIVNTLLYTGSFLLMLRLLRRVVGLCYRDALLLDAFFFSMAYVMLSAMAPEHFGVSMFVLLLTLYTAGKSLKERRLMATWQTALLFVLAAGVTTTNSIKVGLAQWWANGRRLFRWPNLLIAYVVPVAVVLGVVYPWEERTVYEKERRHVQHIVDSKMRKDSTFVQQMARGEEQRREKERHQVAQGQLMAWTDKDLPRLQSVVDNLFGESIQFHERHFIRDIGTAKHRRPVFVAYDHWYNYAVEALVVALLVGGIVAARREPFMGIVVSWLAVDALLHIVLGFALNEVYIMSAHWLFSLPIAAAYIFRAIDRADNGSTPRRTARRHTAFFVLMTALTVYLWWYNGSLLAHHFIPRMPL